MRRFFTKPPEVVSRGDDATTKCVVPQAIDDDAWCQCILLMHHVPCQLATPTTGLVRLTREHLEKPALDGFFFFLVITAIKQRLIPGLSFDNTRGAHGLADCRLKFAVGCNAGLEISW